MPTIKRDDTVVLEIWRTMLFLRATATRPSVVADPEIKAAMEIAEASLGALLAELSRVDGLD
jgi:hypothetical protein